MTRALARARARARARAHPMTVKDGLDRILGTSLVSRSKAINGIRILSAGVRGGTPLELLNFLILAETPHHITSDII